MQTPGRELDIRLGTPVFDAAGQRVGRVDRVVLEPESRRVVGLVVHKGVLLSRDVVVPVEAVREASSAGVRLALRAHELDALPEFEESAYVPLQSKDVPPIITWEDAPDYEPRAVLVPAASLYTPRVMPYAPQLVEEWENIPPTAADLATGVPVECADGLLGTVAEVLVDPAGGQLAGVVVQSDHERWRIPAEQLEVTDVGGVRVKLRRCEVAAYAEARS